MKMDLPPSIPSQRVASNADFWLSFKNGIKNGSFTFGSYPMIIDEEEVVFISYRTPLSAVLIDELKDNDFEAYSRLSKMVNTYHFPVVNSEVGYPESEFSAMGPKYRIDDQQFIMKMSLEDFDEEPDMIPYLKYKLVKERNNNRNENRENKITYKLKLNIKGVHNVNLLSIKKITT